MTKFDKAHFHYHGGYLTYHGPYDTAEFYTAEEGCHPTLIGTQKHLFVARFKHRGPVTKAQFVAELIKNWTVEEFAKCQKAPLVKLMEKNPEWYNKLLNKFMKKIGA